MTVRFVVLASGRGSNAAAIMTATRTGVIQGEVVAVFSNNPTAGVSEKAHSESVVTHVVSLQPSESRLEYDTRLCEQVRQTRPDIVVLAGWMRILTHAFIDGIGVPIINIHPGLPGELPGTNAIERAFSERETGRSYSGVMVHLVPDVGVDTGPVLGTSVVQIGQNDTLAMFEDRMHTAEHELIVSVLAQVSTRFSNSQPIEKPTQGEKI